MSAADYNALKRYLNFPLAGRWVAGFGTGDPMRPLRPYWRECQKPDACTHRFKHNDDRNALVAQAEEAALLLRMGASCKRCDGDGWTWRDDEDFAPGRETCFDCNGTGLVPDSDTPAIDRLAMRAIGPVPVLCDRCLEPFGSNNCKRCIGWDAVYTLPVESCDLCLGRGRIGTCAITRSTRGIGCLGCKGTGRVPTHEYQSVSADVRTLTPAYENKL